MKIEIQPFLGDNAVLFPPTSSQGCSQKCRNSSVGGERQTEDLKVPGSIPGFGIYKGLSLPLVT